MINALKIGLMAAVGPAMMVATSASAVITTFATFSSPNSSDNFRFVNSGNAARRTTDAVFYTTASKSSNVAGATRVNFSFLESQFLPYVTNTPALFTLSGTVAKNTPAFSLGGFLVQPGASGSFSFISTKAITVGGPKFVSHTYAAGSDLLSGTFTNWSLGGQGSSGSISDSNLTTGTVTFSSDFLDFTPTVEHDLALALTGIVSPGLQAATGADKALKTFRAVAGGQFSSDPTPLINGLAVVPEPGVWMLMVAGFGLVGFASRRHGRAVVA